MLYGIAYGADDLPNAINTLHMAKEQWLKIIKFLKEKYITKFIDDINNWDNMINTIETNFY
jgi:type IV secretory pathway VirJ component